MNTLGLGRQVNTLGLGLPYAEDAVISTGKSGVNRLKEIKRLNRIREEDEEIIKIVALLLEKDIL